LSTEPADFEAYSVEHPQLHAADAYPDAILPLLAGRSGVFLDVGAGFGSPLRALAQRGYLQGFSSVIATDISSVCVASMKRELRGVEALQADALALPLPSNSVDVYFSDQVIEHVANDRAMAAEAYRLVKPGGVAFIGSVFKRRFAWYFYRSNGRWTIDPTHLREYDSVEEYRRVFTDAGFRAEAIALRPISHPLHRIALVTLVRCRLMSADRALRISTHPLVQAIGRLRIPVPRYCFIYATLTKDVDHDINQEQRPHSSAV